jgi:hypothetical protein
LRGIRTADDERTILGIERRGSIWGAERIVSGNNLGVEEEVVEQAGQAERAGDDRWKRVRWMATGLWANNQAFTWPGPRLVVMYAQENLGKFGQVIAVYGLGAEPALLAL